MADSKISALPTGTLAQNTDETIIARAGGSFKLTVAQILTAGLAGTFGALTAQGAVALSPANANVVLSPTGTGVVTINPATAGTINNCSVGATTPLAGTFTALTANTSVVLPNGSLATPAVTFAGGGGVYRIASGQIGASNGTAASSYGTSGFITNSAGVVAWVSSATDPAGTQDVILVRDAAAVLALKNSTTAQAFRVYGTITGTKYVSLSHDGTNGVLDTAATSGFLSIAPTNATSIVLGKNVTTATAWSLTGLSAAAGGSVTIQGGPGTSTTGGAVNITGGTATSGAGSNVTITAGSGAGGTNAGGDVNLIPGAAVSTGVPGEVKINSARGIEHVQWVQMPPYGTNVPVTATSYTFFIANRACRVVAVSVIASSTTTPTVDVFKDTGTNAPGAGTSVLTGAITFSGTANTRVTGTVSSTVATITLAAGDRLSTKWGGTIGAITGAVVSVLIVPV